MAEEENTVYVGSKPTPSYVLAVVTQISEGRENVSLKARGKSITKAVDVVERLRNQHMPEIEVTSKDIGTDIIEDSDGNDIKLSSVTIELEK
jgi:DNA-binding protein